MDSHELIDAQFDRAVEIIQSLPKTGPIQTGYEEKLTMYRFVGSRLGVSGYILDVRLYYSVFTSKVLSIIHLAIFRPSPEAAPVFL